MSLHENDSLLEAYVADFQQFAEDDDLKNALIVIENMKEGGFDAAARTAEAELNRIANGK